MASAPAEIAVPKRSLLHKTGWSALASVGPIGGRFLLAVMTARWLGPEGAGRLAYLLFLAEAIATLTGFGLQSSVTRFVADLEGQGQRVKAEALTHWLYSRYLLLAVLGAAILAAVPPAFGSRAVPADLWLWLGGVFLAQALGAFYIAYLSGRQRFDLAARLNWYSGLILVAGGMLGTVFFGLAGTLAGYLAGSLPPAVLSLRLLGRAHRNTSPVLDRDLRSRCLRYAMFAWLAAMVSTLVWSRMEVFFLERYWGAQAVAMFTVGITLSALATQGPMLLSGALMPHFAESAGLRDSQALRRAYAAGTRLLAVLLFPMCLGLASLTPVLLPALYGNAFRPAVPSAMVLIAFSSLAFAGVASALVYGSGRSWFVAASGLSGAVLSLAGCLLVVPVWGSLGAAWSRSLVQTAMVALGTWYIARKLSCPAPIRALGKTLLAASLAAGSSYLIVSVADGLASVAPAIAAAAVVYLIAVRRLAILEPEDVRVIRGALDKLAGAARWPRGIRTTWIIRCLESQPSR